VSRKKRKNDTTRVILIGEFPVLSEALGVAVSLADDMEYVGSASTMQEAVDLVTQLSPDVAVIDLDLRSSADGDIDGLEVTKRVKEAKPQTRVLILTGAMDLDDMAAAAADGACGFLAKTSNLDDISQAIRTAKNGGMFVERELLPQLLQRVRGSGRVPIGGGSARPAVTPREQDVLTLLGEGLDVSVIAQRLEISQHTCRGHVKNLLVKLGSHSQLEAVVEAVHQGLLPHLSR
jgi:DNA-binding NarL/FixJ family response regulator